MYMFMYSVYLHASSKKTLKVETVHLEGPWHWLELSRAND